MLNVGFFVLGCPQGVHHPDAVDGVRPEELRVSDFFHFGQCLLTTKHIDTVNPPAGIGLK